MQPEFPGPFQPYPPPQNPICLQTHPLSRSPKECSGLKPSSVTRQSLSPLYPPAPAPALTEFCHPWLQKSGSSWAVWAHRTLFLLQPLQTVPPGRCCQESAQKLSLRKAQKSPLSPIMASPPCQKRTIFFCHLHVQYLCHWVISECPALWDYRD